MVSFGGLFFLDGKDSKGRPVAVINASKLPEESDMRSTALQHILACLEPHADETGRSSASRWWCTTPARPPRDPPLARVGVPLAELRRA